MLRASCVPLASSLALTETRPSAARRWPECRGAWARPQGRRDAPWEQEAQLGLWELPPP